MDKQAGGGNSEQPCHVATPQTSVSKNVVPANCLIPVCQPGLSTTVNTVEDLSKRTAGQGREAQVPMSFHTLSIVQGQVY